MNIPDTGTGGGPQSPANTPPAPAPDQPPAWAQGLITGFQTLTTELNALKAAKASTPPAPPANTPTTPANVPADYAATQKQLAEMRALTAAQAIEKLTHSGLQAAGVPADKLALAAPALEKMGQFAYDHATGAITGLNAQGVRVSGDEVVRGFVANQGKFFVPPVNAAGTGINSGGGNAGGAAQRNTIAEYSVQELLEMEAKNPAQYKVILNNSIPNR